MGYDKNGVLGGVTSGAYRVAPWHGLGDSTNNKGQVVGRKVPIEGRPTGRELLVTAGLDWQVEKVTLADLGVTLLGADEHAAIVRTDQSAILGIHSDRYGEIQNSVLGEYTDAILRTRGDANPVAAVELWGGRVIFIVIEFTDLVKAVRKDGDPNTDKMTRYMGLYTSHDGSYPLAVKYMNHLWVCQNTFTPWNAKTGFVVRHTRNGADIAAEAVRSLEVMVSAFDKFDEEIQRLLDVEASKRVLTQAVIPAVIGKRPTKDGRSQTMYDNTWQAIVNEFTTNTRQETAFDCVMAVQGYEQHTQTVRNNSRDVATIRRLLRDDYPLTAKAAKVFASA